MSKPDWTSVAQQCIKILPSLGQFDHSTESIIGGKNEHSLLFNPSIDYPTKMTPARRGKILKESDVINSAVTFGVEGKKIRAITDWDAAFFTTTDKKRQILLVGLSFMCKE